MRTKRPLKKVIPGKAFADAYNKTEEKSSQEQIIEQIKKDIIDQLSPMWEELQLSYKWICDCVVKYVQVHKLNSEYRIFKIESLVSLDSQCIDFQIYFLYNVKAFNFNIKLNSDNPNIKVQ